jgi:hypothetical protein
MLGISPNKTFEFSYAKPAARILITIWVGTHSIQSGATMALFLANEQPPKSMNLGHWSSDAFLAYIRPQVQKWTTGMSTTMLQHNHYNTHDLLLPAPMARTTTRLTTMTLASATILAPSAVPPTFFPSSKMAPTHLASSWPWLHIFH